MGSPCGTCAKMHSFTIMMGGDGCCDLAEAPLDPAAAGWVLRSNKQGGAMNGTAFVSPNSALLPGSGQCMPMVLLLQVLLLQALLLWLPALLALAWQLLLPMVPPAYRSPQLTRGVESISCACQAAQ
jgi:hypothetical protein